MAKEDEFLFAAYISYYAIGSRFEHSDPSSLSIYRQQIEDLNTNEAFILDLSRTDDELNQQVLDWATRIYCKTYMNLLHHFKSEYMHLINRNGILENLDALAIYISQKELQDVF